MDKMLVRIFEAIDHQEGLWRKVKNFTIAISIIFFAIGCLCYCFGNYIAMKVAFTFAVIHIMAVIIAERPE